MNYDKDCDISFALGAYAVRELLERRGEIVRKIYTSRALEVTKEIQEIFDLASRRNIKIEDGTKIIERIGGKQNIYIMAEFAKFCDSFSEGNQIVLYSPSDMGNVGTILRTALGFGFKNIAFIKPCVDVFNPKVVRASQGAIFGLNIREYDDFNQYLAEFLGIKKYLLMLDRKAKTLQELLAPKEPFAVVFGNEASGLPDAIREFGEPVFIKHSGEIDSLNLGVSVGMVLFKLGDR